MNDEPAFEKFHSTWITNNILAMQRPSDEIMENNNLIQKFADENITAIFNLTEPGEHPYCGYGLKASGFPYTPENFMRAGSKHNLYLSIINSFWNTSVYINYLYATWGYRMAVSMYLRYIYSNIQLSISITVGKIWKYLHYH